MCTRSFQQRADVCLGGHVPVPNGTCCSREPELVEAGHRAAVSSRLSICASRSLSLHVISLSSGMLPQSPQESLVPTK